MNGAELIRLVDVLHREKDIDRETIFEAVEGAIATAIRKRHETEDDIEVRVDRESGEIMVYEGEYLAEYPDMGRIQAQTAKQVIIQKIREAESEVIYGEFEGKVGDLINGTVQRIENSNVIVNLGKAEGFLPRNERIRGENYQPGERIKALIYDVQRVGNKVKILLTRASPDFVVKLFELEVPEIGEKIIEIKRIAREAGHRTKVAVSSYDMRVDCIGACVGIRGTRIKSITDELNDERIDIIRWNESTEILINNSLRPAQIDHINLDEQNRVASVIVPDDQLSLAIGRKGQNVRLASKLTDWDIKIQGTEQRDRSAADPEHEDPEVTAAREALLQGTSLEAIYSRAKKKTEGEETDKETEESADQEAAEPAAEKPDLLAKALAAAVAEEKSSKEQEDQAEPGADVLAEAAADTEETAEEAAEPDSPTDEVDKRGEGAVEPAEADEAEGGSELPRDDDEGKNGASEGESL